MPWPPEGWARARQGVGIAHELGHTGGGDEALDLGGTPLAHLPACRRRPRPGSPPSPVVQADSARDRPGRRDCSLVSAPSAARYQGRSGRRGRPRGAAGLTSGLEPRRLAPPPPCCAGTNPPPPPPEEAAAPPPKKPPPSAAAVEEAPHAPVFVLDEGTASA